jgi:diguanylate cyclase (GGDEF)-like protein
MSDQQLSRMLCVGDDPGVAANLQRHLDQDFEVHSVLDSVQALEMFKESGPYEAVIVDVQPGGDTDSTVFLQTIKDLSPATVRILLATEADIALARQAVDQGVIYRFLVKPCSEEDLVEAINSAVLENTRTIHKLQLKAETNELASDVKQQGFKPIFDPELGIGSSDALMVEFEYTYNIAVRYKRAYSIAVFDIDVIREYGEHYGPKAAKLAHKLLAEHIRHTCRSADRLFRVNDETEVALLLPETDINGTLIYARRAVQSFVARNIPNSKSDHALLTISSGLAGYDPAVVTKKGWEGMLDDAQLYLHIAQGQGGNTVTYEGAY